MAVRGPALRIDVLTLFPRMFDGVFGESLLGKARAKRLVDLRVTDIRDFADDRHRTADDRTYGGGPGMVMKAEPIFRALKSAGAGTPVKGPGARRRGARRPWVIHLSPQGRPLTHAVARELARRKRLVLLAGHYEGVDERILDWVDDEISVGEAVLTGGEIPAMTVADAAARQVPGVVKEGDSLTWDSFAEGWEGRLDCPHYTRPAVWRKRAVPPVLLGGDHRAIAAWRDAASRRATAAKRPDLTNNRKASVS